MGSFSQADIVTAFIFREMKIDLETLDGRTGTPYYVEKPLQ